MSYSVCKCQQWNTILQNKQQAWCMAAAKLLHLKKSWALAVFFFLPTRSCSADFFFFFLLLFRNLFACCSFGMDIINLPYKFVKIEVCITAWAFDICVLNMCNCTWILVVVLKIMLLWYPGNIVKDSLKGDSVKMCSIRSAAEDDAKAWR